MGLVSSCVEGLPVSEFEFELCGSRGAGLRGRFEDRFRQGPEIGSGNFSKVYSCVDQWAPDGAELALKVVDATPDRSDPQRRARVLAEVEIMRRVRHHPGVIHLVDVFEQSTDTGRRSMLLVS
jgi:serine/threonine protein kinase